MVTGPAAPPDGVEPRHAYTPPTSPTPPRTAAARPPRDWWRLVRHWLLRLALVTLGVGTAGIVAAAVVDMPGDPDVVVDVRSEAVVLVPDTALDLVGAMRRRTDAPAAVTLDPPWLGARADSVTARFTGFRHLAEGEATSALPAAMLRHLELTAGCELHVDRLDDGWIRLGFLVAAGRSARAPAGSAAPECRVRAELWTGSAPEPADSLRPDGWVTAVPRRQAIEIHAHLTGRQPATLYFRPAAPLRLRSIPVRQLAFETHARGPIVESAILGGTVRFPALGDASATVHAYDALALGAVEGSIVELAAGDELATLFKGSASDPRIAGQPRRPSMLQWLYHKESVRLFLAVVVGLIALVAGVVQAIRSW